MLIYNGKRASNSSICLVVAGLDVFLSYYISPIELDSIPSLLNIFSFNFNFGIIGVFIILGGSDDLNSGSFLGVMPKF